MEMLMTMCVVKMMAEPNAMKVPRRSRAWRAVRQKQSINPVSKARSVLVPRKPVSSAMTEKMKSVEAMVWGR